MTTWLERELSDPALAQYIATRTAAEVARAVVDLAALRVQVEQQAGVIKAQGLRIQELARELKAASKGRKK